MKNWKLWLPDVVVVLLFVVISFAYFFPADIEGRVLYRHDSSAGRGAGQEATEYLQRTGERTRWTNALFGGMPTYQMSPTYPSTTLLSKVETVYHLGLPENVWYVFVYLLGFYILLRAFDFRVYLAALGAVIWAFSSYFFIIIAAGHIWKVMALAYLPPMIAGVVLAYRGKYLWGMLVTAIFAALEVLANHVQMTYYYLFIILAMVIAFCIEGLLKKQYQHLVKATAACLAGGAIGVCINISNLYHTWEYGQESMRGKSELVKANSANQTSSGLDRDYITQWSYGIDETWTLLVPNAKGGASVPLSQSKTAMKHADEYYMGIYQQLGQYWGNQPMTAGPVYVGAFVLMLFVLGLFIVKGPLKWALLAVTILSILLSWGRNFMPFTDFFLDYIPMYAKFRTVASILVIAEFTIPLLAMLALKKLVEEPEIMKTQRKWLVTSFVLTGGVALLFALMPTFFFPDFISYNEMQAMRQLPADQLTPLLNNLTEMRVAVFTEDCWRSFWIIVIGTACLLLYQYRKLRAEWTVALILVLCLVDMWQVNKRYLNDEMFVSKTVREEPMPKSTAIDHILQDKSLDYRVLNLATSTFNENETSYYLKSIGGYHAAKLRRYQELIEEHLSGEMSRLSKAVMETAGHLEECPGDSLFPVLNMLNMKYAIVPLKEGRTLPVRNPWAQGNGWFVEQVRYVPDADAEIAALHETDLRRVAVVNETTLSDSLQTPSNFPLKGENLGEDSAKEASPLREGLEGSSESSSVELTAYEANRLAYKVRSQEGGVVVFSEIYYPGWTCTIDGNPTPIVRANYVLRAVNVPAGEHEVVMTFDPQTVHVTEAIAYAALAVLGLMLIILLAVSIRRRRQQE